MSTFNDIISSEQPTLVDFYADWCGPCKMQVPVLKELSRTCKDKVRILKVDIDKNPAVSVNYDVRSIPTLILFQSGEILWRHIGFADYRELEQVINYHSKWKDSAA